MKIEKLCFDSPKGEIVHYRLTNSSGAHVTLSNLGAGIVEVTVPDREGNMTDVALGYASPADYFYDGACCGKIPGRFANRIANGRFSLDAHDYQLETNNGPNHLHGGTEGFANRLWNSFVDGNRIVFALTSPDGDSGYPAELNVEASYLLGDDNSLRLDISAMSDGSTIVNLTNHAYFNLAGEGSGSVLGQRMWLKASHYLPTDSTLIPTGEFAPVAGTPMDFTEPKALGRDIKADFDALRYGKGYDSCWVVDAAEEGKIQKVAEVYDSASGRCLEVESDQPAVQVYTGNWLKGNPTSKSGRGYDDYDGVAIECQHMPDSPNKPAFPSVRLDAGQKYAHTIMFKFSVK